MPIVVGGLILSFCVMLLFGGTEIDHALLILFRSTGPDVEQAAALLLRAAAPMPLLLVSAAAAFLLLLRRQWVSALLLGALVVAGRLAVAALQRATADFRPTLDERITAMQALGFPNDIAANAAICALALAFLLTRHAPARSMALGAAAVFTAIIGMVVLVLGLAWPSDVIGGWAFGLAWSLLLLKLARVDLDDGTARPRRHSSRRGDRNMDENPRTESARANDDSDIIENADEAPEFGLTSGGQLQRDIGSRAEMQHGDDVGEPGVTRVRDQDKSEGENLPRFNER